MLYVLSSSFLDLLGLRIEWIVGALLCGFVGPSDDAAEAPEQARQ